MIIPTYTLLMISALEEKEAELKLVGRSLGLSSASLFFKVVLPSSKRLLFSSSLISFGRIFGETIIVAMVAGNVVQVPTSLLDPVRSLTSNMALEMAYALDTHQSALFFSGFLIALLMSLLSLWAMKNEGGK
jgi:phosphate transport system permease protein